MIPHFVLMAAVPPALQLDAGTGGTVQANDVLPSYASTVGIRFNTDGTVDKRDDTNGGSTWDSFGNWIEFSSGITGNEEVRFTNFNGAGGGDWTSEAAADDVWTSISATPIWQMQSTSEEIISFTCDFEVRDTTAARITGSSSYTFLIANGA